jgi:hypothetical protein
MAEYASYGITQYKQSEQQDDGLMGSASPPAQQSGSSSFLGNAQRAAIVGFGVYTGAQIISGVTSNIKNLTGSSAAQARVDRLSYGFGLLGATIATKGAALVFEGIRQGIEYVLRDKNNQIIEQAKQEERRFLGQRITNGTGSAYYD